MAKPAETVSNLQPYPAYKPSGVKWLGDVPAHWKVRRLKAVANNVVNPTTNRTPDKLCLALEHVESWTGRIRPTAPDIALESQVKQFETGDVLFGKLRPYLAKVAHPGSSGVCVGEFLVLRPRTKGLDPVYLSQLLRSKPAIDEIDASTFGAKMPRAEWVVIGSSECPLPPLDEQSAIARYLDHADRRIRCCIQAKKNLVKLLEEQRQTLVNEAVTGRVDVRNGQPYAAYKPSGVEWLGEVPTHWVVASLRHRYQQCLGKMLDTKHISGEHLFPYLRNTDVQWDEINVAGLPTMDIRPVEVDRYTVRRGDLLVCEGGEVGRCAIWDGDSRVVGYQKALHRLRPHHKDQDIPRFMYYALRSATERGAFDDGHESTIRHLTGDKLRAHRFPFPPFSEQSAIAHYLDHTDQCVRRNIRAARRQIHLLNEYRTRLIADVVTGKLDVREAAAQLPDGIEQTERSIESDAPSNVDPGPAESLGAAAWETET